MLKKHQMFCDPHPNSRILAVFSLGGAAMTLASQIGQCNNGLTSPECFTKCLAWILASRATKSDDRGSTKLADPALGQASGESKRIEKTKSRKWQDKVFFSFKYKDVSRAMVVRNSAITNSAFWFHRSATRKPQSVSFESYSRRIATCHAQSRPTN